MICLLIKQAGFGKLLGKHIEYFKMLFDGKLTNHLKSLILVGTVYSSFIKVVYNSHVQEVAHQNER